MAWCRNLKCQCHDIVTTLDKEVQCHDIGQGGLQQLCAMSQQWEVNVATLDY